MKKQNNGRNPSAKINPIPEPVKSTEDLLRELLQSGYSHGIKMPGVSLRFTTLLSGANLAGSEFSNTDLTGADISFADLSWADFSRANLAGVNLLGANLEDANLSGASLAGANLTNACFRNANLQTADLSGANVSGTDFEGANTQGMALPENDIDDDELLAPPSCNYCGSEDGCEHIFVFYDETFGLVEGGILYHHIESLIDQVRAFLSDHISLYGFSDSQRFSFDPHLQTLWNEVKGENNNSRIAADDSDIEDMVPDRLIIPFLLGLSGVTTFPYVSANGGFPCESSSLVGYSKDPARDLGKLSEELSRILNLARNFNDSATI